MLFKTARSYELDTVWAGPRLDQEPAAPHASAFTPHVFGEHGMFAPFDGGLPVGPVLANVLPPSTRNFILNGDAETGPMATDFATSIFPPGWAGGSGSFTSIAYAASGSDPTLLHGDDVAPGGLGYFAGGPGSAVSTVWQEISLLPFAAEIDGGQVLWNLSFDAGGYADQNDGMSITVTFYGGNGDSLGDFTIPGAGAGERGGVTELIHGSFDNATLPGGARAAIITLEGDRVSPGSYNDAYADNLVFTLSNTEASGGVVAVKTNHDFHHQTLGTIPSVQFETTRNAVTATFASEQFVGGNTLILGDTHADTLAILIGASHQFIPHGLEFGNWTPGTDKVVITGSAAPDTIDSVGLAGTVIHGGDGGDAISISGVETVFGDGGDDSIIGTFPFGADAKIDGGSGNDVLIFTNDLVLTFKATTLVNVEAIEYGPFAHYTLVMNNANVAAGATFTLRPTALTQAGMMTFDGSKETNGHFHLNGASGNDTFTGGALDDVFTGGLGVDHLNGGGGPDHFVFTAVEDSTSSIGDVIDKFDTAADAIDISQMGSVFHTVDTAITRGKLTTADFDTNLARAANAAHLHTGDAVLFTASSGDLKHHTFLIVDVNGHAGYQADQDLVIEFTHGVNLASFSAANIIH